MIIGIDPGITGALFFYSEDGKEVYDMPIMQKSSGKGNQINPYELANLLDQIYARESKVYLERVNSMPNQGVASMFSFGKSAGIIEGVLAALKIPVVMVTPNKWKKKAGLTGKDKDAARTLAIQLYPDLSDQLSRKKDIGRADAILIAHFGKEL
jgi:crossover junction endodeoxyribonuclease RuvC